MAAFSSNVQPEEEELFDAQTDQQLEAHMQHVRTDAEAATTLLQLGGSSSSQAAASSGGQTLAAAGSNKGKHASKQVRGAVEPPSVAPLVIYQKGSNRQQGRFKQANAGGLPRVLPNTNQPVTTEAERNLFADLMVQQRGSRVNFKEMRAAFNAAFYSQVMPGQPGVPLSGASASTMIFTKSIKQLRAYHKQMDTAARQRENMAFNNAITSAPLPAPQQVGQMQQSLEACLERGRKRQHNMVASPSEQAATALQGQQQHKEARVDSGGASSSSSPLKRAFEGVMSLRSGVLSLFGVQPATAAAAGGSSSRGQQERQQGPAGVPANSSLPAGAAASSQQQQQEWPSGKGSTICVACLLLNNKVLFKATEHLQNKCPMGGQEEKKKATALAAVLEMKNVGVQSMKKGREQDFSSPAYIEFLFQ